LLACAFRQQLLQPSAQVANSGRSDQCDFVAADICQRSQDRPQNHARVFSRRNSSRARVDHLFRAVKEAIDIQSHDRARHHAEIGQRGIAPADAGHAEEYVAETILLRDLLQLRTRVGNGDKLRSCLSLFAVFCTRSKKYCLKMLGSCVLPDLLETMNRVLARSSLASVALICAGSVESSTSISGWPNCLPKVTSNTSGQGLDPPMPNTTAWRSPARVASAAASAKRCRCAV